MTNPTEHDDDAPVYVVTTPKGFTQIFGEREIRALVLLGLIEHERDGWLLENGKGEHIGPVHHFYRNVTAEESCR